MDFRKKLAASCVTIFLGAAVICLAAEETVDIYLQRQGETVPGQPRVVEAVEDNEAYLFENKSDKFIPLERVDASLWRCRLIQGHSYVIGWWSKEGWFAKEMYGYSSLPFTAEKEGQTVIFEPGLPSELEFDLRKLPDYISFPVDISLRKVRSNGQFGSFFGPDWDVTVEHPKVIRLSAIARGTYKITVQNDHKHGYLPHLYDTRTISIKSGQSHQFDPICPRLDTTVEPGDVTIRGTVKDITRGFLSKEPVHLWMLCTDKKGTLINSDTYYNSVKTDHQGRFEFTGVTPGRGVNLYCGNESLTLAPNSLSENAELNAVFVLGRQEHKLEQGKMFSYPILKRSDGQRYDLSSCKGKILVIDFWATWCGPCRRALPNFDAAAKDLTSDAVQFLTISMDTDYDLWKKTVNESDWKNLSHYWFDALDNNFEFETGPIPFYIIVDKSGMIRIAGNEIDFRKEIAILTK